MTRAEFFGWLKSKANLRTLGAAYGSWNALVDETRNALDGVIDQEQWTPVCKVEELGKRPRVVFGSGRPIYVYKGEQEVTAFVAECPGDKNYLQWSDAQNGYYCPICEATFTLDGKNDMDGKPLATWPCRIDQEVVFVKQKQKKLGGGLNGT